jgi:hypothetical protein
MGRALWELLTAHWRTHSMNYAKKYLHNYYKQERIERLELVLAIINLIVILTVILQGNTWIAGL